MSYQHTWWLTEKYKNYCFIGERSLWAELKVPFQRLAEFARSEWCKFKGAFYQEGQGPREGALCLVIVPPGTQILEWWEAGLSMYGLTQIINTWHPDAHAHNRYQYSFSFSFNQALKTPVFLHTEPLNGS